MGKVYFPEVLGIKLMPVFSYCDTERCKPPHLCKLGYLYILSFGVWMGVSHWINLTCWVLVIFFLKIFTGYVASSVVFSKHTGRWCTSIYIVKECAIINTFVYGSKMLYLYIMSFTNVCRIVQAYSCINATFVAVT